MTQFHMPGLSGLRRTPRSVRTSSFHDVFGTPAFPAALILELSKTSSRMSPSSWKLRCSKTAFCVLVLQQRKCAVHSQTGGDVCSLRTPRASGILQEGVDVKFVWEYTAALWGSAIGLGYFQEKKAYIFGKGYAQLEGFTDLVILSDAGRFLDALGQPATFPRQAFRELQSFVYKTSPEEDELKAENARGYWDKTINSVVEQVDRATRDKK